MNVGELRRFARGGMAELFTARVDGATVIVKLARTDRGGGEDGIAGEAAALARMEPGVAPRLLGRVCVDGRDGIVMEHVALPTLRAATPLLGDRVDVAIATCEAVARIHAAGMVHGDLGPDNVLVDPIRATVRVIDFGAAAPIGTPLAAVATPAYAAPERMIRGCLAEPAIDVYALGVMIFELLTGELPFGGARGVCRTGHRAGRIPRLAERVAISAAIDEVIAAAMSKRAASRPAGATALTLALRAGHGQPSCLRTRVSVPAAVASPAPSPRLARGTAPAQRGASAPLVGRAREITALVDAVARARAGEAVLVTVSADPGLGKSRLAEVVLDEARRAGFEVVALRAPTLAAAVDGGGASSGALADRAALVAAAHGTTVIGTAAEPLAAAPGSLRQAAARALAATLAGSSSPRAIVVDDAHAADPIVLDALELATMGSGPLLVVALARPALLVTRKRWGTRARAAVALALAPLDAAAGRALARSLLPAVAAVPAAALDRLVERCGGVPLHVAELVSVMRRDGGAGALRGALATDQLERVAGGDVVAFAVDAELARLVPAAAALAEILAVVDRALAAGEITALAMALEACGIAIEIDPEVAIGDLVRAGLLVDDSRVLRFRHDLVRAAVARRVTGSALTAIHRAVLRSGLDLDAAERARHADGAGDPDADAAWRAAAAAALARHDDLSAEAALGRALACAGVADAETLRRRGSARMRLGRHDAAAADFAAARELAEAASDRGALVDVLLDEATALDWAAHYTSAAARVAAATLAAGGDEPPLRRARLLMGAGRAAWRAGDEPAATAAWPEAIALADAAGDAGYETAIACRVMLGFVLGRRGEIEASSRILDEALAAADTRGDLLHRAAVLNNRYPVRAARGDAAGLRDDLAAFAEAGRALGMAVTEYRGEIYQAFAAMWCGDDAAADGRARAAHRLEDSDAELFPRPRAAILLAELAARAGDEAGVRAWLARARAHGGAAVPRVAIDAVMIEALEAWLDGLDEAAVTPLANRAVACGEAEAAFELFELVAVTAARRRDEGAAASARHAARTVPPGLPRFIAA